MDVRCLFKADIDGKRFLEDLRRDIERPIVFDVVMKVRTSSGKVNPIIFTSQRQ